MRTITFYSYKGGTGRTLLMANLAMLAASLGRNVVALDFDLEAPGLPYKLFAGDRPRGAEGLVGWLRDTRRGQERPAALDDYVVDVPLPGPAFHPGGSLTLMPAGRAPSLNYFQDLRRLRLEQALDEGWALDALVDLRERLASDLGADLLLVDARTGITPTNRVTTHVLADDVVALALDTPEQLEGTRSVLRSLQPFTSLRTGEKIGLHLVLSRVVPRPRDSGIYVQSPAENEQVARVLAFLTEPAQPVVNTVDVDHAHLLHHDPSLNRSEFLALARPGPWTQSTLHVDYWRIATAVLGSEVEDAAVAVMDRARDDPESLEELGHFFAAPEIVIAARGLRSRVRTTGIGEGPQLGLEGQVEVLRQTTASDPTVRPELAALLVDKAGLLRRLGRRDEAFIPMDEAVCIYRALAEEDPAHEPDLASALNNLSVLLGEAGRIGEGVASAEEAVEVYLRLAVANPAAYEAALVASLNNLSVRLGEAGGHDDGLTASEEAVSVLRRLVAIDPAAHGPALAGSLNNLSMRLGEVGRYTEGLTASMEAVTVSRQLVAAEPAAHEPTLAGSLNNLSIRLSEAGRRDEALASAEEASAIYRRLATASPTAYQPDLALTLNNLSIRLGEKGRSDEALSTAEEASDVYRRLAAASPGAYQSDLAMALNNTSAYLHGAGRNNEALVAIEQAVAVQRRLVDANPVAYEPVLARSLNNSSVYLAEAGRRDEALAAIEEAAAVWRRLAKADPGAYEADLAVALINLASRLGEAGRRDEALEVLEAVVASYRRLAGAKTDYAPDLALSLYNLSVRLGEAGKRDRSLMVIEEAVAVCRHLATANPAAYVRHLAVSLYALSNSLTAIGRLEDAKRAKDESEELTKRLLRGDA